MADAKINMREHHQNLPDILQQIPGLIKKWTKAGNFPNDFGEKKIAGHFNGWNV